MPRMTRPTIQRSSSLSSACSDRPLPHVAPRDSEHHAQDTTRKTPSISPKRRLANLVKEAGRRESGEILGKSESSRIPGGGAPSPSF